MSADGRDSKRVEPAGSGVALAPNANSTTMARMARTSAPVAFRTHAALRKWLQVNHATKDEQIVRCFKVHAAHRGGGYREALDEALCFGWIDGVRHALDSDSFTVRFTPRKEGDWSPCRRGGGRGGRPGAGAAVERQPEARRGAAATAWRIAGGAVP